MESLKIKFKSTIIFFICILIAFNTSISAPAETHNIQLIPSETNELLAFADQYGQRVLVFRGSTTTFDEENILWEWRPSAENGYDGNLGLISDIRLRYSEYYSRYIMAVCSKNGFAAIVSYPDGEILWFTERTPPQPEAIELLPDGNVCVAASSGNCLRVFSANSLENPCSSFDYTLNDAHGLYYKNDTGVLWALGNASLVGLKYADNSLNPIDGLSFTLPTYGGHELYPVSNTDNLLWVSAGITVFQFDTDSGSFISDFQSAKLLSKKGSAKSLGTMPYSGTTFMITPSNAFGISGSSSKITCVTMGPDGKPIANEIHTQVAAISKVRVWVAETCSSDGLSFEHLYPAISGIENGKTYKDIVHITVDRHTFAEITINGSPVSPNVNGIITLKGASEPYQIIVENILGNSKTYTITVEKSLNIIPLVFGASALLIILITSLLLLNRKKLFN